jgi:MFS family permease
MQKSTALHELFSLKADIAQNDLATESQLLLAASPPTSYKSNDAQTNSNSTEEATLHSNATNPLILTMDEAMDRLGYGRFQNQLLWAAGLCLMSDGLEILLLSFLTVVLRSSDSSWHLTNTQTSSITASVFAGALVGTLVLGRLADTMGRKPIFTLTAAIIAVFGALSGVAPTYLVLLTCRFWVGFGVGGLTVPFDLFTEFLPRSHRGQNLLTIYYFWTAGTMLVVVLAFLTLGQGERHQTNHDAIIHPDTNTLSSKEGRLDEFWEGWRVFVILCSIPCIFSTLYGLTVVPESPRWFVTTKKDPKRALEVMRKAATVNGKDPDKLFPSNTLLRREGTCHTTPTQESKDDGASFADLFTPRWRRTTLYLWGTWIGFAFLYYGGVITTTMVFASSRNTIHTGNYHFDYGALFISNSAEIVGTAVMILTADSLGRIHTQCGTYFLGGAMVLVLCLLDACNQHDQYWVAMVLLAFGTRMLLMISTCTTWVSTAEIFPTDIRATGHSAANAVARIGGFICPYVIAPSTSIVTVGLSMFGMACFTTICCWNLPETQGRGLGSVNINTKAQRKEGPGNITPARHQQVV